MTCRLCPTCHQNSLNRWNCSPKASKGGIETNKLTQVETVYRTTDGSVWSTKQEAEQHQKLFDLWDTLVERYGMYGELRIDCIDDFIDVIKFYEENK